jgi:integrase
MVDLDERVITIRLSKMNHGRSVPLHAGLANELGKWKAVQMLSNPTGAVFSLDGIAIGAGRVTKIGHRVAVATGLPLTTHVLRHTFATWALRRGGNLFAVSKALGHKDLKQTEIYLSATIDDLRPIVESLPDIGEW